MHSTVLREIREYSHNPSVPPDQHEKSAGRLSALPSEFSLGSSPGREDPLEEEMATHSGIPCLENPMDRGAWQATVHGVAESDMTEHRMCIIDEQRCVSFRAQQRGSVSRIHVSILFSNYFPIWVISESLRYSTLLTHSATPSVSLLSEQTLVLGPTLAPHGGRPQGTWPWAPGRGGHPTWHSCLWHLGAAWLRCLWAGVIVRLECWPGTSTEGGGRRAAAAESPGL